MVGVYSPGMKKPGEFFFYLIIAGLSSVPEKYRS
jgi:hypothetical protein